MKQEIKERVETIRKGEVPKGYKNTKVGIIPEDWEVIKLKEIGSFSKGKGISKLDVINCGKGCVRYGEIYTSHHVFIKNFKSFISDEDASNSKLISKGDILFAGSGETAEEIGKSVCYMMDNEAYAGGDIIILSPKNKNNYFYGYVLNHNLVNKQTRIKGQGQSVVHIYSKDLESVRIPNPHNYEENKIAEILSTWDKAIELKQKLIEEKKVFKRGLMQKLLTGKTRFPEFTDDWREKRLHDILKVVTRNEEWDDKKLYHLVSVRRRSGGVFYRGELFGHQIETKNLVPIKKNDFLISKMQVVHGALGLVENNFENYYVSGSYIILQSKEDNLNINFFNYLSQMPFMYHKTYISSYGVHIEKMTFNLKLYLNEKILVPSEVKEQEKIVHVLDLISTEIVKLTKELNQLKEQKRGLMQLLLTGIVRMEVD